MYTREMQSDQDEKPFNGGSQSHISVTEAEGLFGGSVSIQLFFFFFCLKQLQPKESVATAKFLLCGHPVRALKLSHSCSVT